MATTTQPYLTAVCAIATFASQAARRASPGSCPRSTVVSKLSTLRHSPYLNAAAARRGAAAESRALSKRTKYRNDIPGFAHFLALPFETEGFRSARTLPASCTASPS